jgi:hypothetical protein
VSGSFGPVTDVPEFSVLVGSWTVVVVLVVVEPLTAVPFWSSLVLSTAGERVVVE